MGEIAERISKGLSRVRRERDEANAAIIRICEAGDYSGIGSYILSDLWDQARKADEDYNNRVALARISFPDQFDAIMLASYE